jgi:hypothetical protein
VTGAAGGVPHDLRGALAVYGGSLAYADQVLSLALPPAQVAGLPVVFPIPSPGWVQRIAVAVAGRPRRRRVQWAAAVRPSPVCGLGVATR